MVRVNTFMGLMQGERLRSWPIYHEPEHELVGKMQLNLNYSTTPIENSNKVMSPYRIEFISLSVFGSDLICLFYIWYLKIIDQCPCCPGSTLFMFHFFRHIHNSLNNNLNQSNILFNHTFLRTYKYYQLIFHTF